MYWWLYFLLISLPSKDISVTDRYLKWVEYPIFSEFKCPILSVVLWSLKFGPLSLSQQNICWPVYDWLSQISEIFSSSSAARQLYCFKWGEGGWRGNEREKAVIRTRVTVSLCHCVTVSGNQLAAHQSLQSHLNHIIIITLVTRTLTNNSQIPFLSLATSFI